MMDDFKEDLCSHLGFVPVLAYELESIAAAVTPHATLTCITVAGRRAGKTTPYRLATASKSTMRPIWPLS